MNTLTLQTLRDLLTVWGSGGLAGLAAYWVIEHVKWFDQWEEDQKRTAAIILTLLFGALGYLAAVAMLYQARPVDWRGWVEGCVAAGLAAFMASQISHATTKLRVKRLRAVAARQRRLARRLKAIVGQ
jgi:hypothetical protein